MADTPTNRVSMTLDSVLPSIQTVEETAERFALQSGFDEDTCSHIAMVAREATANAILHGNRCDLEKHITASFEVTDAALTIQIADEGNGVDLGSIPDPRSPENLLRSSGRGIFLMRALMDEVHFRKLTPGTQITMVKHRAQKETQA